MTTALWTIYLLICTIIYWPIVYPVMVLTTIIRVLLCFVFGIKIHSVSVGTLNDKGVINFGLRPIGYISYEFEDATVPIQLPYNTLYAIVFISLIPTFLIGIPYIFLAFLHPLLLGIPIGYILMSYFEDWNSADQILTIIGAKKRIENSL